MKNDDAVFTSDITRGGCDVKNNLYDLLKVVPADPLSAIKRKDETIRFTPLYMKRYTTPSKGSKLKVKTVRDIRNLFENDVFSYLPDELEKQEYSLLKKIRHGFSRNEHTIKLAKNMLNGDNPITTSVWQMLANINPNNHKYPKQFVLWNGRCIQVNGSKGGKNKFICNHDLNTNKTEIRRRSVINKSVFKRKIGLLRNSLNIKFKPGPLQKKMFLDDSHLKYQMSKVELIKLPKPALDVYPSYGTPLEPTIASFVNNLRAKSGIISPKWAEYAVSVLGILTNNTPTQLDKKCCITFDLNYKCDQNRLLMRRNAVDFLPSKNDRNFSYNNDEVDNKDITVEVQKVIQDMLNCVEISLCQEDMYSLDDDYKHEEETEEKNIVSYKDKSKRNSELDRLDVTIIKLPQLSQNVNTKPCAKSFCALGCICDSLSSSFNLTQHCGVLDCMFGCKCDSPKFKSIELMEHESSELTLLPGLLKLDNELNSHLAKEEQKFHQTVIVSGEKSIVLKSRKRKCKSSSKYAEYCSNTNSNDNDINVKNNENTKKILTVVDIKLNCKNIVPFCMVHNLYKCFCKGKFTESSLNTNTETNVSNNSVPTKPNREDNKITTIDNSSGSEFKCILRPRISQNNSSKRDLHSENIVDLSVDDYKYHNTCARTKIYTGRKYDAAYYKNTNIKIMNMEENDELLKTRMEMLVNKSINTVAPSQLNRWSESETGDVSLHYDEVSNDSSTRSKSEDNGQDNPYTLNNNKYNLRSWLEASFKWYKERQAKGLSTNSLRQPKKGLSCVLPWEVILSRYRERKNVYFVSKQPPYRTFLGVDPKHPAFAGCLNIDDIRFAELPKYPVMVQNLVTNVTETKNSFCMLRGWDHSWELIGSAVRVLENTDEDNSMNTGTTDSLTEIIERHDGSLTSNNEDWLTQITSPLPRIDVSMQNVEDTRNLNKERSKWFVMKVENDFSEIQFYKRGFFVKYEGIQRSINLARQSGKTVRLSSQARSDSNFSTQYGIYAIPSTHESCVFIGPYELDEPLGIEIVKSLTHLRKHIKTRGVWITTNKIDNIKVIDNPLSFMPSVPIGNEFMVSFGQEKTMSVNDINETKEQNSMKDIQKDGSGKESSKTIRPIKIRRTNIIQNIVSNKIYVKPGQKYIKMKTPLPVLDKNDDNVVRLGDESNGSTSVAYVKPFVETAVERNRSDENIQKPSNSSRPVAEIAPQIKITSVYSESTSPPKANQSKRLGMLILKPDEINKKILCDIEESTTLTNNTGNDVMTATDIKGFLEQSPICTLPDDNVLVISDGEDDNDSWQDVFIKCLSFAAFGYIPGRKKGNDLLSFQVPGFNYSEFYTKAEAFDLINRILARKIFIPKYIDLKWTVIMTRSIPKSKLLTCQDLEDKKYLFNMLTETRRKYHMGQASTSKKYSKSSRQVKTVTSLSAGEEESSNKAFAIIDDLEETSKELENRGVLLLNEAVTRQNEFRTTLSVPENLHEEMSGKLQVIYNLNMELDDNNSPS